jgi:hypothetical protein
MRTRTTLIHSWLQAEDSVDMTPQANGHLDADMQPDGEDIPLPDAMEFHPDDDIAPPSTGAACEQITDTVV